MQDEIARLIQDLKDGDDRVRSRAADALVNIGTPAVEPLILALRDWNDRGRSCAAEVLGKIGDARAVTPLILALEDEDSRVRKAAVGALGKIGDTRAVEPLILALRGWNKSVYSYAAEALGKIGDARAVEPLVLALKDEDGYGRWFAHVVDRRHSAIIALGRIGTPAVEPLILALKNEDINVRLEATLALGRMGNAVTLPRKVLAEERLTPQQRITALKALREVRYSERKITLRYPLPEVRQYCQQLLQDEDEAVRKGARSVLNFLDGKDLLRASQANPATDPNELLRPAAGSDAATPPEELLRASDGQSATLPEKQEQRGLVSRFLRRTKPATEAE